MAEVFPRENYLEKLRSLKGFPIIKSLTGIRRCGKSTLMLQFIEELKSTGIEENNIVYLNFDENTKMNTWEQLIEFVEETVKDVSNSFIFLDEIQNIPEWEKAVAAFFVKGADIYITGSNSQMLSTELSTKLSGRCLEIKVQPLVFKEYILFRKECGLDTYKLLEDFIHNGGFPAVVLMEDVAPALIPDMLEGIYNTVYTKEVVERTEIRNAATVSNVFRFIMKNIGDRTSVRSISNYLTSSGNKTRSETVLDYLAHLEKALLIYKTKRMDWKSKEYLNTFEKYYAADIGLRNNIIPFAENDLDGIMENIVFNELMYRYGEVSVCSIGPYEIDFVTNTGKRPEYFQVSLNIGDKTTRERELRPLKMIEDNYPKTVIVYDRFPLKDIDGIRIVSLHDWLLE